MEFIGLKLVGFLLWTGFVWYVGKRWSDFNSTSDVAARLVEAKALVQQEITNAETAAKAAADKAAALKAALIPNSTPINPAQ